MWDGRRELANSSAFLTFYIIQCPMGQRSKLRSVSHRQTKRSKNFYLFTADTATSFPVLSIQTIQSTTSTKGNVMYHNVKISAEKDCHIWGKKNKDHQLGKNT